MKDNVAELLIEEQISMRGGNISDLLGSIDRAFCQLEERFSFYPFPRLQNVTIALVHTLISAIQLAQEDDWEKDNIRSQLPNAWRIHGNSSFINHIQNWPRGHPGDFQAINMIVDRKESSSPTTIEGIIGRYAINSVISQQHREKLRIQAELVREICCKYEEPSIMSIACGPSRDLELVQRELSESRAKIFLIDFDEGAISESMRRLSAIGHQITPLKTDVRKLPTRCKEAGKKNGKFHLIYAGGLFDYLPNNIIKIILKNLSNELISREYGKIMFTNINENNPYQAWMETMAEWTLIERGREIMREFLALTNFPKQSLELDPTGLTWIAKASN